MWIVSGLPNHSGPIKVLVFSALGPSDGISVNQWITARLADVAKKARSPAFLAAAGADPDFPEIEDTPFGTDAQREPLD
jgi:hypothetical protein